MATLRGWFGWNQARPVSLALVTCAVASLAACQQHAPRERGATGSGAANDAAEAEPAVEGVERDAGELDASEPEPAAPVDAGHAAQADAALAVPADAGDQKPAANHSPTPKSETPAPTKPTLPPAPQEHLPPLPSPLAGACHFDDLMAEVVTDNPNCPNGVFEGNAGIFGASDIESLRDCKRITGSLNVELGDARDLTGLESLRVIEGSFVLLSQECDQFGCDGPNAKLMNLHGLEGLRCVGADLTIRQRDQRYDKPLDVTGLEQLVEVGGTFSLQRYQGGSANPVPSLRRVWGDYDSRELELPPKLEAIYGRLSINTPMSVPPSVYVGCAGDNYCRDGVVGCDLDVTSQSALDQLSQCEISVQDLRVHGADIHDLTPLSKLQYVGGELAIGPSSASPSIASTAPLAVLRTVNVLTIRGQADLTQLEGLSKLGTLRFAATRVVEATPTPAVAFPGDITLADLPLLSSLQGLPPVDTLETLAIDNCASLQDLTGLEAFHTIQQLSITGNTQLQSLQGLGVSRAQTIHLGSNPVLTDISALTNLEPHVSTMELIDLPALPNLKALPHVPMDIVTVNQLPLITDLSGLEGLGGSAGWAAYLHIQNNERLENIDALLGLRSLMSLQINGNPVLKTLAGLDNVTKITLPTYAIENNALLRACEVYNLNARVSKGTAKACERAVVVTPQP